MASKAVDAYTLDESGVTPNPKPGTQISAHNRVDYLTHANFHKHLLGEGLPKIYRNFSSSLARRLPLLDVQEEWRCLPDVMDFWLPTMTSAMNEAIAGPLLECVNPSFTQNLLKYYPYLQSLMKGTPRLLVPEAYQLQESLIGDVKIWHAIARARFQESEINPETGNDPWWGSAFIRERQQMLKRVDGWDYESIASSDFGVLWGYVNHFAMLFIKGYRLKGRNPQSQCQHTSHGYLGNHRSLQKQASLIQSQDRARSCQLFRNSLIRRR